MLCLEDSPSFWAFLDELQTLSRLLSLVAMRKVASDRLHADLSRRRSPASTGGEQSRPETCLGDVFRHEKKTKQKKKSHSTHKPQHRFIFILVSLVCVVCVCVCVMALLFV